MAAEIVKQGGEHGHAEFPAGTVLAGRLKAVVRGSGRWRDEDAAGLDNTGIFLYIQFVLKVTIWRN
jgi:hypothetical protein